jgi:DNA-binding CsgD family transcriptional regulator
MPKKPAAQPVEENSLAIEVGRIAKLLAMYSLKDIEDEGDKILRLTAVGFSVSETALLLGKTENAVYVQISKAKKKLGK